MDESENEGGDEEPRRPDGREEEEEEAGTQWKKEMEAIQRAMDEENKRVTSAQSRRMSKEDAREHSRGKSSFIPKTSRAPLVQQLLCCCQQHLKRLQPLPAGGSLTSRLLNSVKSARKSMKNRSRLASLMLCSRLRPLRPLMSSCTLQETQYGAASPHRSGFLRPLLRFGSAPC